MQNLPPLVINLYILLEIASVSANAIETTSTSEELWEWKQQKKGSKQISWGFLCAKRSLSTTIFHNTHNKKQQQRLTPRKAQSNL